MGRIKNNERPTMKLKNTVLAFAAMTAVSSAATISVNFTESATAAHNNQQLAAGTTAGLTGYVAQNWNNVATATGTVGSLNQDDAGTATVSTASVTWGSSGVWGDAAANGDADFSIGDAQLARGYLDDGGSGVNFDVTGVSYASYTLVLYFSTDTNGGVYNTATVNGSDYNTTGTKSQYNLDGWDETNSIVITDLSGDLAVDVLPRDGANRGSIAGFQIVDTTVIPEPSSSALLGLGGLALILRRRK